MMYLKAGEYMDNLVFIEKNDTFTTSSILSKGVGNNHNSVIQLIRNHEKDLNDFGTLQFQIVKTKGRPTEVCYLNEPQTYFLMTLMRNNEKVSEFKKELVREFMRMRKALITIQSNHQNEEWKRLRSEGKAIRIESTDTIKDFVEYAIKQGSKNASTYYSNISKMENKALFILEQKFPNVREVLTGQQLATLRVADKVVMDTLQEGMELSMNYKEIYQLAKERIEKFAEIVRPSIVVGGIQLLK